MECIGHKINVARIKFCYFKSKNISFLSQLFLSHACVYVSAFVKKPFGCSSTGGGHQIVLFVPEDASSSVSCSLACLELYDECDPL